MTASPRERRLAFRTVYDFDPPVDVEFFESDGTPTPVRVTGFDVSPGAVLRATIDPGDLQRSGWAGQLADDVRDAASVALALHLSDAILGHTPVGYGEALLAVIASGDRDTDVLAVAAWTVAASSNAR